MLLNRIEAMKSELRKSEQKVADVVLSSPNAVVKQSIAVLAGKVGVSEPTVIRFCRALGFDGYQDFKLHLAQDLASGVRYFHREVLPDDQTADFSGKIFDSSIAALMRARNLINTGTLQQAIDLLSGADRIEFYGQGASGFIALDAQHKFFPLGCNVVAYTDPQIHRVAASLLRPECVVVAISQSGCSEDIIRSVEIAVERGSKVLAITPNRSELAKRCSIVLGVDDMAKGDIYKPVTSRLPHLVIIDVLAAGVALRRGPELTHSLERAQLALNGKRDKSS